MAGQRSDLTFGANRAKRIEPLLDPTASDELDRQILEFSLRYDPQTGLLNHHAFQNALAAHLRSIQPGEEVALIWIDLLNLRKEFSLLGWTGAEALARRIAETLRSVVDDDALLGRFGARSFLVAMGAYKLGKYGRRRVQDVIDMLTPQRPRDEAGARQ